MLGAIFGDIVGSPYEFDRNNIKTTDFPLLNSRSEFTDDSVITVAVAAALEETYGQSDEAIRAFLEGADYENVIRLAVSIGGDSDTIACIAGGIAEAYYGMPEALKKEALAHLDDRLRGQIHAFHAFYRAHSGKPAEDWKSAAKD